MSVTNLNKARKTRARKNAKARAAENAVAFGRTKTEKAADLAQKAKSEARVDDHKRER
ncbi:MAG: DUF4169 family protein [Paracoccaceae bacterium]